MLHHGFLRVAAAVPSLRVADCRYNAERILGLLQQAEQGSVAALTFPEQSVTGYTCADLFHQTALQQAALDGLVKIIEESQFSGLAIVGMPLVVDDQLYNCAVAFQSGQILGVIPKQFVPNYKEFYERRWFALGGTARTSEIEIRGQVAPFGTRLLFDASKQMDGLVAGIEVCEDLWVPIPPSCQHALSGATLLFNLSASNETIGKARYRRQLTANQSGRCVAAYVYCSSGVWESTTDVVFGGHCIIAENAEILAESERFRREEQLLVADLDLRRLISDRVRYNSFGDSQVRGRAGDNYVRVPFSVPARSSVGSLRRHVEPHPFVPSGQEELRERCEEIFHTQVAGLAKRLESIGKPAVTIGVSGGLDSTLGLLVTCKTFDLLDIPRAQIRALTMPGFGTTPRTRNNASALMQHLGVTAQEIDIRKLCLEEMKAMEYEPFGINLRKLNVDEFTAKLMELSDEQRKDLVFENVQARMRTSLLMNTGFQIGTGDLSELALGWCTYNADHMSNYNPNVSIPKTLVRFLVRWVAENEFEPEARPILLDIVATEISPELLPPARDGSEIQSTEESIGPYELHDFFLFHFLRYGETPEKLLFLAEQANFDTSYSSDDLRRWLRVFIERFFGNQFKRSCQPDGPKVGSVSLSPRGDWRMPSDAAVEPWLSWLESENNESDTTKK